MKTIFEKLNIPERAVYAAVTPEAARHAADVLEEYIGGKADEFPGLQTVHDALRALDNDTDFITTTYDVQQWGKVEVKVGEGATVTTGPGATVEYGVTEPAEPAPPKAPDFHNGLSVLEGWCIATRSTFPPYAIEKVDDPNRLGTYGTQFDDDDHACKHVRTLAEAGSAYHRSALDYLKTFSPGGYRWAMGLPLQQTATVEVKATLLVSDVAAILELAARCACPRGTPAELNEVREKIGGQLDVALPFVLPMVDERARKIIEVQSWDARTKQLSK